MKPRYINICKTCNFLGQQGRFDLYWCKMNAEDTVNLLGIYKDYLPRHEKIYGNETPHLIYTCIFLELGNMRQKAIAIARGVSEPYFDKLCYQGIKLATEAGFIRLYENLNET